MDKETAGKLALAFCADCGCVAEVRIDLLREQCNKPTLNGKVALRRLAATPPRHPGDGTTLMAAPRPIAAGFGKELYEFRARWQSHAKCGRPQSARPRVIKEQRKDIATAVSTRHEEAQCIRDGQAAHDAEE